MRVKAASGPGILLLQRGERDVFEAASKAAARKMRDAAITDAGEFDADERLCVTLRWRGREKWQARRDGQWVDICIGALDADED